MLRSELIFVGALLALLLAGVVYEASYFSVTTDEPSHLVSAHLYWHGRDRLYPRDMPPVIKIASGWPSALMGLPVPADLGAKGDKREEWVEGAALIGRIGTERLGRVMFLSRLPMAVFALGVAFLLWFWARQLHGAATAAVLLALWVFSPTPLAHAALVKNDIASTCMYLLFWYVAWRFWREPGLGRAAAFGLATALVVVTKMSMLFLLGVAPLVILGRMLASPRPGARRTLGWLAVVTAVVYGVVLLAYQFEVHWTHAAELGELAKDPRIPGWFLAVAPVFQWIPAPEGMWTGVVSLLRSNFDDVPVYMLGQIFYQGHPLYFVVALVLKFPAPSLLLFVGGVVAAGRELRRKSSTAEAAKNGGCAQDWAPHIESFRTLGRRGDPWGLRGGDLLWVVPGPLYFVLASTASLQLGARLTLPSWPFFLLIAGVAVKWMLQTQAARVGLAALVLLQVGMTVGNYPHGISHFNAYAGPPWNAWRLLNDSNIDWGQALPDVRRVMLERNIDKLRLSYFGFDQPDRYFAPGQVELIAPPWSDEWAKGERYKPAPGWYAISACFLPGHFFIPKYREYYAEFRNRMPVVAAGGSILIYRVD